MNKFRIMVVDDEEDVRTLLRLTLSPTYEVVEAYDGLDALDKIELAEPDFIVLDVIMPLMDGFQTCKAIRKHPQLHAVPVLFLSAKRAKEEIMKGYEAGATLYLTKPFDPDRLVKTIAYALERACARVRPKRYTIEQLSKFWAAHGDISPVAPPKAEPAAPPRPAVSRPVTGPQPSAPATTPEPPSPPPPPPRAVAPTRPRVMIVEDDEDLRSMLSLVLREDFEVTTAPDGLSAVERIINYQPDFIILDAMLPKMSGYQLCASLRQNQSYRNTPILFISAKCSPRDIEYCKRLGANDFFSKPFDLQMLRQRLLQYAMAPGFVPRPKKMTLEEIILREGTGVERPADADHQPRVTRKPPDPRDFIG
ncbi:MAG: response regulator [Candidatus Sumerlaeia bacterium]|nr:response regulator [Candidatus Sumerlaeia bacterium]